MNPTDAEPVGVLAAWGRLPVLVAEALRRSGRRVVVLGVRHHAEDDVLRPVADEFHWIGASRIGYAARHFRRAGVSRATMCGKFHKVDLYRPWVFARYLPDLTTLRVFYSHFIGHAADRRDDTLLGGICEAFAHEGVTMEPATDFAPELLVREGHVAGGRLTPAEEADVAFGWALAKEMGRLDVGQSVCVKGRAALAIEAIEGTDLCIQRAGELCRGGGFTVVKVAKPDQDMRFDVPTVGVRTLETMAAAGGRILAIEADQTILLDRDDFERHASRLGIKVVACRREAALAAA